MKLYKETGQNHRYPNYTWTHYFILYNLGFNTGTEETVVFTKDYSGEILYYKSDFDPYFDVGII